MTFKVLIAGVNKCPRVIPLISHICCARYLPLCPKQRKIDIETSKFQLSLVGNPCHGHDLTHHPGHPGSWGASSKSWSRSPYSCLFRNSVFSARESRRHIQALFDRSYQPAHKLWLRQSVRWLPADFHYIEGRSGVGDSTTWVSGKEKFVVKYNQLAGTVTRSS